MPFLWSGNQKQLLTNLKMNRKKPSPTNHKQSPDSIQILPAGKIYQARLNISGSQQHPCHIPPPSRLLISLLRLLPAVDHISIQRHPAAKLPQRELEISVQADHLYGAPHVHKEKQEQWKEKTCFHRHTCTNLLFENQPGQILGDGQ